MERTVIRKAKDIDIISMVELSKIKRQNYEKAQPQFWKYSGTQAEEMQSKWFKELLTRDDYIILVADENSVIGFVIGHIISAPEVYNPGGLTLMIDDFCIDHSTTWEVTGGKLIEELKSQAKFKGASQILIVSGAHDKAKRRFLQNMGLTIASEWYVGEI